MMSQTTMTKDMDAVMETALRAAGWLLDGMDGEMLERDRVAYAQAYRVASTITRDCRTPAVLELLQVPETALWDIDQDHLDDDAGLTQPRRRDPATGLRTCRG